jgi:outer membrane immunogenic protein
MSDSQIVQFCALWGCFRSFGQESDSQTDSSLISFNGKRRKEMKLSRVMCLLSLACVLVFSQNALAAECAPSFCWTGPYVGVHLGYGWSTADTSTTGPLPAISAIPAWPLNPDPSGVVGGAQAGYNWQCGCFVYGIEADFSGSGMSGSQTVAPIPNVGFGSSAMYEKINWYGTLRPRLGYTVTPTVLIYATGGLAYGDVSCSGNVIGSTTALQYPVSFSTEKVGWALGGGVEYAFCRNWTFKAEYMYMDLGSESAVANATVSASPPMEAYSWQTTANIFQIGMNYKF